MTKTIFLLDIGNFAPEVKRITLPFIQLYADRIGADIHWIKERKFPDWPVTYEKLQIHELAQLIGSDWFLYIDLDTLIHPECPDYTVYLPKGTVSFHSPDHTLTRFKSNPYFLRDGRYRAFGNWFTIASDLCVDLWRPLDMRPQHAIEQIFPTPNEIAHGITAEHLVDDFAVTLNMARFGLTVKFFTEIEKQIGMSGHLFHQYTLTIPEKVAAIEAKIVEWKVEHMKTYGLLDSAGH